MGMEIVEWRWLYRPGALLEMIMASQYDARVLRHPEIRSFPSLSITGTGLESHFGSG